MSKIIAIETAVPSFCYKQTELYEFMSKLYTSLNDIELKKIRLMYERSGIAERYSVLKDYKSKASERTFYPPSEDLEPFPNLERRMELYFQAAPKLSIEAIRKCFTSSLLPEHVTHIITVSCTGLAAPGLEVILIKEMGFSKDIERSAVNFMGCYAAIHALKQADYICKSDPLAIVLVVCVELCSIHFQKENDMNNIAANLLFADGASAAIITHDNHQQAGLSIKQFYSYIELAGQSDMAWNISGKGFLMTLSAYIPSLIEKGIHNLINQLLIKLRLKLEHITHWAIHPGGRKILEVIQKELTLNDEDLASSYKVLKNYGNMSSPTILFVLKDIWQRLERGKACKILGVAFGPGLTMESFILEG